MPNSTPENLISIIPQMEILSICRTIPSRGPRPPLKKLSLKTADLSPKINGPSASFCHILGRKRGSDREGHFHPSNCHRMWGANMEASGPGSKPRASSSIPGKAHQERKRRRSDQGNAFLLGYFHENSQVFMSLKTIFLTSRHCSFISRVFRACYARRQKWNVAMSGK